MKPLLLNAFELQLGIGAIILVLVLFRQLFKKRYLAKTRYWIWLALAIRLVLPFDVLPFDYESAIVSFNFPDRIVEKSIENTDTPVQILFAPALTPSRIKQNAENPICAQISLPTTDSSYTAKASQPLQVPQALKSIYYSDILLWVWIIGSVFAVCITAVSYFLAKKRLLCFSCELKNVSTSLDEVKAELCISQKIKVLYCSSICSPLLMGTARPIILLPSKSYEAVDLAMIFRHELVHFRRKDIAYKVFMRLVACLYWYNPLVSYMCCLSNEDMEISCDDEVINNRQKPFKAQYAESIIKVITVKKSKNMPLTTYFAKDNQAAMARFSNILYPYALKKGRGIICLLSAVAIFAGTFVGCGAKNVPPKTTSSMGIPHVSNTSYLNNDSRILSGTNSQPFDGDTYYFYNLVDNTTTQGIKILTSINSDGSSAPLCKKAACKHNSTSCSGYTDIYMSTLFTIDGEVYGLSDQYKSDGSTQSKLSLYKLDFGEELTLTTVANLGDYDFTFGNVATDKDFLYVLISVPTHSPKADTSLTTTNLLKVELSSGDVSTIWSFSNNAPMQAITSIVDGFAIIRSYTAQSTTNIYSLNLETGESKLIKSVPELFSTGNFAGTIIKDKIYSVDLSKSSFNELSLFTEEEKALANGIMLKQPESLLSSSATILCNGVFDNHILYYSCTDRSNLSSYTPFSVELKTFEFKELGLKISNGYGEKVPMPILAELNDFFLVVCNYKTPMTADVALIVKDNYWNSVDEYKPVGTFTIA